MIARLCRVALLVASTAAMPCWAQSQYADNTPPIGDILISAFVGTPDAVHVLDIVLVDQVALIGGRMIWVLDVSDEAAPDFVRQVRTWDDTNDLVRNGDWLYACSRSLGLQILDLANPLEPLLLDEVYRRSDEHSYERGLVDGQFLYLAAHEVGVEIVDISSPLQPAHLSDAPTTNAFALAIQETTLFVADGIGGLHVLDVSDPRTPESVASHATSGLAIDVAVSGDFAYVAVGSAGVDIFDVSDPGDPQLVANHQVDGFTNRLTVSGGLLYLANWEGIEIVDISAPEQPVLLATQHSFIRAMSIEVRAESIFVGDWTALRIYGYLSLDAPDINADPRELRFGLASSGSTQTLPLLVENVGQLPLSVSGLTVVGDGFDAESISFSLEPGESREVTVSYSPPDGDSDRRVTGFVNVLSDDPDEPEKIIRLVGGDQSIGVGDIPPDFALQDLDGTTHRLQEAIEAGSVIYLSQFGTW